jgi:HlyD family secretion protein
MKKWIIAIIVLAILGVASWFGYQEYQKRQKAKDLKGLQVVAAGRGDLVATIGATGQVRSNQTAVLSWQASGIVDKVEAKIGDEVAAQELLSSLVTTSLAQNMILAEAELINANKALKDLYDTDLVLAQAESDLANAKKVVEDAQKRVNSIDNPSSPADIDAAKATVTLAKDQLDKAQKFYKPYKNKPENNIIRATLLNRVAQAQQKYDAAVRRLNNLLGTTPDTTVSISEADLDLANAQVFELEKKIEELKKGPDPDDVRAIQARIDAAQATLDLARLKAPFNATVTDVSVKPGDQAVPGTIAFRLDDLSHLLVDVQVSEVDINRVKPGQKVTMTFDAIQDKEYQGVVSLVDRIGRTVQGVTEFTVTVELVDADENVRPGMTSAVNFVVEQIKDVVLVPNRAVRTRDGKRVVYILVDDETTPVEITLGSSSDLMSQVLRGDLKVGDLIVLNPSTEFESDGRPAFLR